MIDPMLGIVELKLAGVRVVVIVLGLGLWFLTQWLISRRDAAMLASGAGLCDRIHDLTAPLHARLLANPKKANALLIASSLVIDLVSIWVLLLAIFGATFQPFLGLLMVFALRQICQMCCPLPPPNGMIWRHPGFPALLVTYGCSSDLFFSGHTALAVFGAACLGNALGPVGIALGIAVAIFEITTVLVLRAHYTMDVFTGTITAMFVYQFAWKIAPTVDQWLAQIVY
ncbi:MAG TPA: phosphatase PAP2-related protein [Tepidisphaeraceae bacterium]|nr:phosphatase PAP2-related protein [Tepidisphaeraceae bacterium]